MLYDWPNPKVHNTETMSTVKYTRLPMADGEDSLRFDYSSAFTFEERSNRDYSSAFTFEERSNRDWKYKYKSAFTYDNDQENAEVHIQYKETSSDRMARLVVTISFLIVYIFAFPILVWFSFKKIPENERLVVFRLGRLHKLKGPGLVFLFPVLDRYHKIDVRLKAFSVPPKQVITGDGAIIEVGAEIYFQIIDAEKSVTNVQNLDQSTRILVQTALCNILVQKSLADIESERRTIADTLLVNSNKASLEWGVEITRAELSQIKVLSGPPAKKAPTFVTPPGLFGAEGAAHGALPAAFAQLAAAIGNSQGQDQTQAITQALHSVASAGLVPGMEGSQTLTSDTNDLAAFLGSGGLEKEQPYFTYTQTMEGGAAAEVASSPPLPVAQAVPVLKPEDILGMIRGALCESVVQKVGETYQFEISGAGAGTYYLDLKHGSGAIGEGPHPSGDPAATLSLTFDDLQAMLLGQLKPFQAYMSGRLRVSGDTAAALKLEELGNRIQSLNLPGQALC